MEFTIYVAKTKALISCTVTTQIIFAFIVFAYAKSRFAHDEAHFCSPTYVTTRTLLLHIKIFLKIIPFQL